LHEFVPGPVSVHEACESQPPLPVAQESMAVHVVPFPLYPVLHLQVAVPAPVEVQCACEAQPPLLVAHAFVPVQVIPSPE
jgi:hypothetical protein